MRDTFEGDEQLEELMKRTAHDIKCARAVRRRLRAKTSRTAGSPAIQCSKKKKRSESLSSKAWLGAVQRGAQNRSAQLQQGMYKDAEVVEGEEFLTLRPEGQGEESQRKWEPPLMEEDRVAPPQALFSVTQRGRLD